MDTKEYSITSLTKEDIQCQLKNNHEGFELEIRLKIVESLSDSDMEYFANKMRDDYVNQLFWTQVDILCIESLVIPKHCLEHEHILKEGEDKCFMCADAEKEQMKENLSPREQHQQDYPEDARARTFDGGF